MKPLVATNVKQSFQLLNNGITDFPPDFNAIAAADASYKRPFTLHGSLTFRPVLYREGATICCAQRHYFGFYAFQQTVRGLLLSINHLVGGDILVASGLHGPAVASYYTAAYHALQAFLALEGHVFFGSPIWPIASRSRAQDGPGPFVGLLKRDNSWTIEPRRRSHAAKWGEAQQVFSSRPDALPVAFHDLFDRMYRGVFRENVDFVEVMRDPDQYRVRLADRFAEFLTRVAQTRHLSIYESFGSDPDVVEANWNRDVSSTRGIDHQAIRFGDFARSLLMQVASDVRNLTEKLDLNRDVRTSLLLSVHVPWFDEPQLDAISNAELQHAIRSINGWLNEGIAVRAS